MPSGKAILTGKSRGLKGIADCVFLFWMYDASIPELPVRNNSKSGSGTNPARRQKIGGEESFPVEWKGSYGKSLNGPLPSLMESLSVGVAVSTRDGSLLYT